MAPTTPTQRKGLYGTSPPLSLSRLPNPYWYDPRSDSSVVVPAGYAALGSGLP